MQSFAMLFTTTLLAVAVAGGTNAGPAPLLTPGFSQNCSDIQLAGSGVNLLLRAECFNSYSDNPRPTARVLNDCLANSNGALVCGPYGRAMESCNNCVLNPRTPTYITCTCTYNGSAADTTFNLDECISNYFGGLVCI